MKRPIVREVVDTLKMELHLEPEKNEGTREVLAAQIAKGEKFLEGRARNADGRLTPKGQREADIATKKESVAGFEDMRAQSAKLGRASKSMRSGLARMVNPVPDDAVTAMVNAIKYAEFRRGLEGLDTLRVAEVYRTGDAFVRAALEDGPLRVVVDRPGGLGRLEPWVTPEQVHEALMLKAREIAPDHCDQLEEIENLQRVIDRTSARLIAAFSEDVEPAPDENLPTGN